jgi:hypothetical protein
VSQSELKTQNTKHKTQIRYNQSNGGEEVQENTVFHNVRCFTRNRACARVEEENKRKFAVVANTLLSQVCEKQ